MFLGLLDPDPLVRGMDPDPDLDPEPSIIKQNSKKNPNFYWVVSTVLFLLFDFLSLKIDVKVPSKSNMQKNFFF